MVPVIIKSGAFAIPTFFFMVMLGILAATFFLYYKAPKVGMSQVAALDFGIVGGISGILGARLFLVLVEDYDIGWRNPLISAWFDTNPAVIKTFWYYWHDLGRVLEFWRGGFVSYGAYIGGTIAVLLYLKLRKLPVLDYVDFVATSIPLMVIFIRIGCLGAGCCYGKPTDFFLHLSFTNPFSDAGARFPGMHLHATQIYDLLNGVFLFIYLNWRYPRRRFRGEVFLSFFILYSFFRALIEFLRGDADRGLYLGGVLSTAQITGLIFIVLGAALYLLLRRRYPISNERRT
jgi:phosphatidylglycerol:prolipoprotein diacylglycerol transferase